MKQFLQHYKDNSCCHNSANLVGLYSSIPREVGLRALREALDNRDEKTVPTEELYKMVKLAVKNNYSEFGNKIKQISGTAIGTKFSSPYAYIFMSDLETKFLERNKLNSSL